MTNPIRFYTVYPNGRAYWQCSRQMKALGFRPIALGPDGPEAREIAQLWNLRWDQLRGPRRRARAVASVGLPNVVARRAEAPSDCLLPPVDWP